MALFRTSRERNLWLAAAGLVLLIYSTLSVVKPVTKFLRDVSLLIPALVLVLAGCVGWALRGLHRQRRAHRRHRRDLEHQGLRR